MDFNYYPFPRIEKGMKYKNIEVDSILDIAVNKVHTIVMKPWARDFIDIYFTGPAENPDCAKRQRFPPKPSPPPM